MLLPMRLATMVLLTPILFLMLVVATVNFLLAVILFVITVRLVIKELPTSTAKAAKSFVEMVSLMSARNAITESITPTLSPTLAERTADCGLVVMVFWMP